MNPGPLKVRHFFFFQKRLQRALLPALCFCCLALSAPASPISRTNFDATNNTQAVAVDVTRNRIYVGTTNISTCFLVYALDASGNPFGTPISSGLGGANLASFALDAQKNRLYAASNSISPLYIFTLDPAGNTTAANTFAYFSGVNATSLALDGTRQCLYLGLGSSTSGLGMVSLNASGDPAGNAAYTTNASVLSLALDEVRHKLYLGCDDGKVRVYNLNPANGTPSALTTNSPYTAGSGAIYSLALDSVRNRLYAVSSQSICAFTLQASGDPGEPTGVPASFPAAVSLNCLTLDATHSRLYVGTASGASDLRWMDLDPSTGNLGGTLSSVTGSNGVLSVALDLKRQRLYAAASNGSDYYQLTDPVMTPLWVNGGETSTTSAAVTLHLCSPNAEFLRFDSTGLQDFTFPVTLTAANLNLDQWIPVGNGYWSNDLGATHALTLTVQADLTAGNGSKTVGVWFWESSGAANINGVVRHEQVSISLSLGTATFTPTHTPSPTNTPTFTATPTASPSFTATPTGTFSATATPSATPSFTNTGTPTSTRTPTFTETPSHTPTFTSTNTSTPSATGTFTLTSTGTPTATVTPTATPSGTSTSTVTPSHTPTQTITPSHTPTSTMTSTGTPTATPSGTPTGTPTSTATPTQTRTPTDTPSATQSATLTASTTTTPTPTASPYFSPTATPTQTRTFTATPTLTASATITLTVTITATLPPTSTPTPAAILFLDKNHFNPMREHLGIRLGVTETSDLNLEIFSLTGRRVWSLRQNLQPGYLALEWDGRSTQGEFVGSGVYFVLLQTNGQKRFVRKVLVIK